MDTNLDFIKGEVIIEVEAVIVGEVEGVEEEEGILNVNFKRETVKKMKKILLQKRDKK